jgi:hypothetical protein
MANVHYSPGIPNNIITAKGDLLVGTAASTPSVLNVGANGKILAADSSQPSGLKWVDPILTNFSVSNQTGFAADTYLVGSSISIPGGLARVGTMYHLRLDMVKTAAGTAASVFTLRVGTLGTTGDAARLTFTFGAGTAAVDTGILDIFAHYRSIGSGTAAVLVGYARWENHLAATGLHSTGASGVGILPVVSAGFDSTTVNSIIGVSFNGGTSFSGTNTSVQSEVRNLNV